MKPKKTKWSSVTQRRIGALERAEKQLKENKRPLNTRMLKKMTNEEYLKAIKREYVPLTEEDIARLKAEIKTLEIRTGRKTQKAKTKS